MDIGLPTTGQLALSFVLLTAGIGLAFSGLYLTLWRLTTAGWYCGIFLLIIGYTAIGSGYWILS